MDIGQLRHPIGIERSTRTQNPETGGIINEWGEVARDWASIVGVRGDEIMAAQQPWASSTHRITIRYRPDLKETDRINDGVTTYDIKALLPDNRRRFLRVMAEVLQ